MWVEAALIAAGLAAAVGAAAAPSPQAARRRKFWGSVGARVSGLANTAALPPGLYYLPGASVEGSGGSGGLDTADAGAALAEVEALDAAWAVELETYREARDSLSRVSIPDPNSPSGGRIQVTQGYYRGPTRHAVIGATYATQRDRRAAIPGIMDPATGAWADSWLALLATYQPSARDWQAWAQRDGGPPPSPGTLDTLGAIFKTGSALLSGAWAPALKGLVSFFAGPDTPRGTSGEVADLTAEEQDLLRWMRATRLDARRRDGLRGPWRSWRELTAQEALSGGESPLRYAAPQVVALARASAPLTPGSRALDDDSLALKLTLLARRHPTADMAVGSYDAYRPDRLRMGFVAP